MIRIGDLQLGIEEKSALQRVIDSNRILEGPECRAFEQEYADFLGVKYCISVSSGTSALICGLTAMKYDQRYDVHLVLLPALTFIATVNAVVLSGLTPTFADVDPQTFCLDPSSISTRYDLAIPVHLFGYPADIDGLSRKSPAPIIEDACEAHGTLYKGHRVGSLGLWSATSFHVAHTLQAGELGLVCTNDSKLATLCRQIKAHGRECPCVVCTRNDPIGCPIMKTKGYDPRFRCLYPGYNFKPMEFSAAIARVQLGKIEENIRRRQENVWRLNHLLDRASDILHLPFFSDDFSYMDYPIVLRRPGLREMFIRELNRRGVESRPMFHSVSQHPAYQHIKVDTPVADDCGENGFYVGCHQYLTTEDIDSIANNLLDITKGLGQ